jgi:elongation factor 1-gamma
MSTEKKYIFYTYPNNPRVYKALIAAKIGGIFDACEEKHITFGVDNKTEEFLQLNPFGKVPTLKTPEGGVWESDAIAKYICRVGNASGQLLGVSPYEQSQVERWLDLFNFTFMKDYYGSWFFVFTGKYDATTRQTSCEHICAFFKNVETQLKVSGKKFLVADHVTLVDITIAVMCMAPLSISYDEEWRGKTPEFMKYLNSVLEIKEVKEVITEVKFIEKFDATKHEKKE